MLVCLRNVSVPRTIMFRVVVIRCAFTRRYSNHSPYTVYPESLVTSVLMLLYVACHRFIWVMLDSVAHVASDTTVAVASVEPRTTIYLL